MTEPSSPARLWTLAAVFAIASAAFSVLAWRMARERAWTAAEASLELQARMLEDGLAKDLGVVEPTELQRRVQELGAATGTRITLIRADGSVVADSDTAPDRMDNLATRPEIVDALRHEFGRCRRWSPTMQVNSLFVARALRHGDERVGWIRVSVVAERAAESAPVLEWALIAGAVTAVFAALGFVTRAKRARAA